METQHLNGDADMSSRQEPNPIHIALFNSLRTIYDTGGKEEKVTKIHGIYSKTVAKDTKIPKSRFINTYMVRNDLAAVVHWTGEGEAVSVKTIIEELEEESIPDIAISKIDFCVPWTESVNYENKIVQHPWSFDTYTFRKGMWKRLKADIFPAQILYHKYTNIRQEILKDADNEVRKRWRDALLLNKPQRDLTNQEIRGMWSNKPYALILRESRGQFELMDLGELKI